MGAGRPTKYTSEIMDLANDYIDNFDEIHDELVPTVVGLCRHIGIAKATVYAWATEEDKHEFSDILGKIAESQEIKLIFGGLSSSMNPAITKMMLSKHGYSDAVTQEVTSGGEKLQAPVYNIVSK